MCSQYDKQQQQKQKPTIKVKSASSYKRERKLSELASIIKGTSYSSISYPESFKKVKTKGSSSPGNLPIKLIPLERQFKLRELARLIRG